METEAEAKSDVPPKLDKSGAAILHARHDVQLFGAGFLKMSIGDDGFYQYERIDPHDIRNFVGVK